MRTLVEFDSAAIGDAWQVAFRWRLPVREFVSFSQQSIPLLTRSHLFLFEVLLCRSVEVYDVDDVAGLQTRELQSASALLKIPLASAGIMLQHYKWESGVSDIPVYACKRCWLLAGVLMIEMEHTSPGCP